MLFRINFKLHRLTKLRKNVDIRFEQSYAFQLHVPLDDDVPISCVITLPFPESQKLSQQGINRSDWKLEISIEPEDADRLLEGLGKHLLKRAGRIG